MKKVTMKENLMGEQKKFKRERQSIKVFGFFQDFNGENKNLFRRSMKSYRRH